MSENGTVEAPTTVAEEKSKGNRECWKVWRIKVSLPFRRVE